MLKPHGGVLVDRTIKEEMENARQKASKLKSLDIEYETMRDIENIANGAFSPLTGFMNKEDVNSVLDAMRLVDDTPWTIPIVLDIAKNEKIGPGDEIALRYEGDVVAILQVQERFSIDKREFATKVFGTESVEHPGVAKAFAMKEAVISGPITLIKLIPSLFPRYALTPKETRILFKEKGWRTIVGFQTRNAPHLGHEYLQKTALTFTDGVFINPVIGRKKKGDFTDETILASYEALIKHYFLKERAVMAILQMEMRYAGPREAIFHAVIRKNFGCTHFIVGRDHAGIGNFYDPFAAQDIFDEFPDLGIAPLFFNSFFYCKSCGGVANEKICPHSGDKRISFSGTKIRNLLVEGKIPPPELMRPEVAEIILNSETIFVE